MSWKSKTFDGPLPALSIRGPELRKSLRIVTVAYMYSTLHAACVSGSQVTIFGQMIGLTNWDFGLMTAIPFIATFAQIVAAISVERTGLRKHPFIAFQSLARFFWAGMAAIPLLLLIPSRSAVAVMLLLYLVMCMLDSMAAPPWWTWMADLIPRRIRGRYMANREAWSNVSRLVAFIAVGVLLDLATNKTATPPGTPTSAKDQPILLLTICGLFVLAGLLSASVLMFRKVREILPPVRSLPRPDGVSSAVTPHPIRVAQLPAGKDDFIERLLEPLRNRTFLLFAVGTAVLTIGANIGGAYLWLNCLDNLGFHSLATNMVFLVFGALGSLFTFQPIGKLIDRFGRKPVMVISAFGTILAILPWAFIARQTPDLGLAAGVNRLVQAVGGLFGFHGVVVIPQGTPVGAFLAGAVTAAVGGVAWAGVGLAQQSYILRFSDLRGRSGYIATFSVIASIGGLSAGFAGGYLTEKLQYLQTHPLALGPIVLNNWQISFVVAAAFRLLAGFLMMRLPDEKARSAGELLRHLSAGLYRRTIGLLPGAGGQTRHGV